MKKCVLAVALGVGCVFANAWGQERVLPRPYIRGDVGASLMRDSGADFFPGVGSTKLEFDPGMRVGFAGGAMFGDYVGLELETGWIFNEIKSIRGFTEPDGWLSQVPLLANVRFEFRNNSGLTPFIGGGAGGAVVGINLDNAQAGAVTVDGSAADLVFAWQAFGGLKYEVIENLSVGIIYKFFWTDDARWDVRGTSQDIHFDGTRTHSISAMVSYRF